jgi:putative membrane protein
VRFLVWVLVNALAVGAAVWLLDGISLDGDSNGENIVTLLAVGLIFGIVNTVIGTLLKVLTLPFILLTLGLLLIVINAAMLMLTNWIADGLDLAFHVDEFWWTAIWGAIIISIATMILEALTRD